MTMTRYNTNFKTPRVSISHLLLENLGVEKLQPGHSAPDFDFKKMLFKK
jgi:hypothetical protein